MPMDIAWRVLKQGFEYNEPQRWFIQTNEYASALPNNIMNELVEQLGEENIPEKLASLYQNGLLIDLTNDTHYTIKDGMIESVNQAGV
tara:strand:+ start:1546 stop:1809 length:264 start_codon:yes stop_codon:yes gene_type:complete